MTELEKLLLTSEDVCSQLSMSRSTLSRLMASGAIESVKVGSARRIPAEAVVAYVEHLRSDPASANYGGHSGGSREG